MGFTNFTNGITSFGNVVGTPNYGIGNTYYVCQTTNSIYAGMRKKYAGGVYGDGSRMLHTDIQSALDATVANREDYVIVMTDSSDYDLSAELTMTKKGVHLIAPGGLSHGGGMPGNAVRVHQTNAGSEVITVTADCVEIAGFFFKGATDSDIINLSGSRWHDYVHHNFFGGSVTSGASIYTIGGTGAVFQCTISDNYIMGGYAPIGAQTISGLIGFTSSSSGRNLIARNHLVTGAKVTVTAGVFTRGTDDIVENNYFFETVVNGTAAGTFTKSWNGTTTTFYIGNRTCMDTAAESGGTASNTHCDNWEATSGNTIIEAS